MLEADEEGETGILSTYLRADGTGAHLLSIPNTRALIPIPAPRLPERLSVICK
ncbi:MAG: hypothetical protein R3D26_18185 [Cyanobacteriota/Melainabacteria group bacterium]